MCTSQIIDFCNEYSGFIQSFFSLLIVLVTVIYVVINSLMHQEMKKARIRSESPEISIRLEKIMSGFYNIVIENISDIPIYNLTFLKYPILELAGGDRITEDIGFLKHGISYMAPHQKYDSFFLNYIELKDKTQTINFDVVYYNKQNLKHSRSFDINLSLFQKKYTLGKPFNEELITTLKEISNSINSLKNQNNYNT